MLTIRSLSPSPSPAGNLLQDQAAVVRVPAGAAAVLALRVTANVISVVMQVKAVDQVPAAAVARPAAAAAAVLQVQGPVPISPKAPKAPTNASN